MGVRKLLLIVSSLIILLVLLTHSSEHSVDNSAMREFLESQYVPEVGLLRASITSYPDNETIWLANDNVLAERALRLLGSPLWRNVSEALRRYNISYNGRIDPLLGKPLNEFFCPEVITIGNVYSKKFNTTLLLKLERANESCRMDDWQEYADLLAYGALSDLLVGNETGAFTMYLRLLKMWDGYGFRDKAFSGVYQTYKCALFIYLYKSLGMPKEGRHVYGACIQIISELQADNGGIITGYRVVDGNVVPVGDANTETTSIVAISLLGDR